MASLTDRTIAANRSMQDRLAPVVREMSDEDLSRPSGATQWSVAQVLSHLGSGAEIGHATLRSAQSGEDRPETNEAIWERWNAMSPREQREGFLAAGEDFVAAMESLDAGERESLTIDLGFLPHPVDLALFSGMRLNEVVLHAWDVEVAFDPEAALVGDAAAILLEQLRGPLGFLAGHLARLDELEGRTAALVARTSAPDLSLGLLFGERFELGEAPTDPDGELRLPLETLLRLMGGRLRAADDSRVEVTGSVALEDLKRVFPGY